MTTVNATIKKTGIRAEVRKSSIKVVIMGGLNIGGAGSIAGGGSTGRLSVFTDSSEIGDSYLSQSQDKITVDNGVALELLGVPARRALVTDGSSAVNVSVVTAEELERLSGIITPLEEQGNKNIALGYAGLDATGKIPTSLLPASVLGQVHYMGTWDAQNNNPNLLTQTPDKGEYYVVTAPGSISLSGITDWKLGDWAIFNGTTWDKIDNTDALVSWNGRFGAVLPQAGDYNAGQITTTPSGSLSSSNVQDALTELDTEKIGGSGTVGSVPILTASRTISDSHISQTPTTTTINSGLTVNKRIASAEVLIAASTVDWAEGNKFYKTIGANTTFTFSNDIGGQEITVAVTQDATGGWAVTWPAGVKWANGIQPQQTMTAGKTDLYTFTRINGTIYGAAIHNF